MKIKVEIETALAEEEIIIRCRGLTEEVSAIQKAVSEAVGAAQEITDTKRSLVCYKGTTEYYLALDEILFFETEGTGLCAHTKTETYQTKYKLYELEDMLPGFFMRVSKSTILNIHHIYSINRNLTASSVVAFCDTHKQVYVSRYYYKPLISKLEEKRLYR